MPYLVIDNNGQIISRHYTYAAASKAAYIHNANVWHEAVYVRALSQGYWG